MSMIHFIVCIVWSGQSRSAINSRVIGASEIKEAVDGVGWEGFSNNWDECW